MKQIATRIQKISLGVITAIFVASFFTSLIPAQSVFAVPADDSSNNPDDWLPSTRAKRWAYLTGLYSCQKEAWDGANEWENGWDNDKIDESNAKDGKWFYDPPVPKLGRPSEPASFMGVKLKDGEKGVADCNDIVNATAEAYSLSPIQLLCKMGGERDDDSPCETSGTGERFNPPDSGDRMDVTEFWGSKSLPESAGGAAYYALNLAALTSSEGCNLKKSSDATTSFAYELKIVDTAGKITTEKYSGQKRDFKVKVYSSYPGLNDQERPCSQLESDLNKYSADYAKWVLGHEESSDLENGDGDGEVETTSCAIDGIGWIVCPVMVFIGRMNDAAFVFLEGVLGIRPAIITSQSTQNAWAAFRDIANIMFVIAFMIIVYSQITSAGISNYGIKKMLPRIVVAAILVNASFIICALAVDLSNIVGSSVYSLLKDSIANDLGSEITTTAWEESIGGILGAAATALGVILLVVALFMAPTVLLAFALIILILIARQALVILLIVIAPLAFVAYLLPNTEDWFKKWQKAFTVTLMVYPIVGLVFGASTLASKVLVEVAQGGEEDEQLLMLIALGVLAVPLFAVPAILKTSLSAAGSIGTKIAGLADRSTRASGKQFGGRVGQIGKGLNNYRSELAQQRKGLGRFDALRRGQMRRDAKYEALDARGKAAAAVFGSTDPRASKYGVQKSDAEHAMKTANVNLEASSVEARSLDEIVAHNVAQARLDSANRVKQHDYSEEVLENPEIARQAGGIDRYGQSRAVGLATQNLHKAYDDGVSAEKTTMSGMTHEQLIEVMKNKTLSSERRAAAAGTIMSRDFAEGHLQALELAGEFGQAGDDEHIGDIQKQMAADMKTKPFALGDQAAGQLKIGTYGKPQPPRTNPDGTITTPKQLGNLNAELRERVEEKLSPAALAKMNPDEMTRIFDMSQKSVADGGLTDTQKQNLVKAIQEARADDQYKGLIKPAEAKKHDKILQDAAAASYGPGI